MRLSAATLIGANICADKNIHWRHLRAVVVVLMIIKNRPQSVRIAVF